MTLFVKIRDFSQIVLWRLHFPVERSAISFFYKPWVIFRHRKKIKNFRTFFLTFSAHRNWIYLKISKKRNFENFVNLFEDFRKNSGKKKLFFPRIFPSSKNQFPLIFFVGIFLNQLYSSRYVVCAAKLCLGASENIFFVMCKVGTCQNPGQKW